MLLSLYSGCGGLDLGFEQVGFEVGLAYDINPAAIASWNRNRAPRLNGHVADLSAIGLEEMDQHYGARFAPTGVIGGPPCQSFSRANCSKVDTDPRRKLVRTFFSIALRYHQHRQPLEFILMENVPELENADGGRLLAREERRLEAHGFKVHKFLLDAVHFTVPQYRKRLFVLAISVNNPTAHLWSKPKGTSVVRTVRQVIGKLPMPIRFRRGLTKKDFPSHPNHWCMNPRSQKFFDGSLVAGSTSGRSFKTLAWDAPSVTAAYGHREVHVHPDGQRRLSVFEGMRIQGFPDNYILEGHLSAQIDQVSEAVPPPLAEAVASSVAFILKM